MKTKEHRRPQVNIITLGCSKNLVDSENIMTQLQANAFDVSHEKNQEQYEVVIVNTCGFIEKAKEESINTILRFAEAKEQGKVDKLLVTGCLSQRYKADLAKEIPQVDAFFGTMELPAILENLEADYKHELLGERSKLSTLNHFAYLKISEGCNRTCAFCAIPLMRGKHQSKTIDSLVREAKNLAAKGVKEILLIAQELTYYGLDIYKERKLKTLLEALCDVEGIEWIRLHYAYPHKFPLEIIELMRKQRKICNYLDIPLQHGSDAVLGPMKRQISAQETRNLIKEIREIHPEISIRTTMLVGFPTETDEAFQELKDFVKEMRFDRLGVFTYSQEEGTSGFDLGDPISSELKNDRANSLMELQQSISEEVNQSRIGQVMQVLIDRKEGDFFFGRTQFDSPEVDNEVLISAEEHYCRVGDFVKCKITGAEAFDLYAQVL